MLKGSDVTLTSWSDVTLTSLYNDVTSPTSVWHLIIAMSYRRALSRLSLRGHIQWCSRSSSSTELNIARGDKPVNNKNVGAECRHNMRPSSLSSNFFSSCVKYSYMEISALDIRMYSILLAIHSVRLSQRRLWSFGRHTENWHTGYSCPGTVQDNSGFSMPVCFF